MQWIVGAVVIAFLAASVRCWAAAAVRLRRGGQLAPWTPRRAPPWGLVDLLGAVALLGALQYAAAAFLVDGGGGGEALRSASLERRAEMIAAGSAANLAMVALSAAIILLRTGACLSDLGVDPRKTRSDAKLGLIAFVMLAPVVYAIQGTLVRRYPSTHPLVELIRAQPSGRFFAVSVFAAVLAAPLAEEYLFRVLLQGWLEKAAVHRGSLFGLLAGETPGALRAEAPERDSSGDPAEGVEPERDQAPDSAPAGAATGSAAAASPNFHRPPQPAAARPGGSTGRLPFWPILVSSLVFALLHLQHGPDCVALFVLALGLGYLYQRTHRMLPSVLVHALLNACSLAGLSISIFFPV